MKIVREKLNEEEPRMSWREQVNQRKDKLPPADSYKKEELPSAFKRKKKIADNYLLKKYDVTWDDLSVTNSLWDYGDDKEDIINACEDRIENNKFYF